MPFFSSLLTRAATLIIVLICILGLSKPSFANVHGLRCLVEAYPQTLSSQTDIQSNILIWRDGTRMSYDDGVTPRSFEELLEEADLKDQMSMPYPMGKLSTPPAFNADPGRVRHEAFFEKMYGESESEVRHQLTRVYWSPAETYVSFSQTNGAANALALVGQKISAQPDLAAYVRQTVGTFNWRNIHGTNRKSNHSFGIAIDFKLPNPLYKYWQWSGCRVGTVCPYPSAVLRDTILQRIVTIFEMHGFIWGGKWHHYDVMHFEYRPELTHPLCSSH
ncbi:MAG: hypothetical protein RLZZ262_1822 [Bacteroidota bacterium]|jgi:hypothetical protein